MEKNNTVWIITIVTIVILVLGFIVWGMKDQRKSREIVESPVTQTFDQSISDDILTIKFLSSDFGLATNASQILLPTSTISPCNAGFAYCFYLSTTTYDGSNFESAGISLKNRTDLKVETECLDTPPEGYDSYVLPDARKPEDLYSTSVFKNVGDSGAGRVVTATVYRLFYKQDSSCYELMTKIAYTQFDNSPKGTIREFAQENIVALQTRLDNIIDNISIKGGTIGLFP